MPPRLIVALITLFWLSTLAWLGYREWWPWLNTDGPPPFIIELTDEAAEQHALWTVWRNDQKLGSARSHFAPRKDDTFEFVFELRKLEVSEATPLGVRLHAKIPKLDNTLRIDRNGLLLSTTTVAEVDIGLADPAFTFATFHVKAELEAQVRGNELHPFAILDGPGGRERRALEPVPLTSRNIITPMLPLTHIRGLTPGRRWQLTAADPLGDALIASLTQTLSKIAGQNKDVATLIGQVARSRPKEMVAEVLPDREVLDLGDYRFECLVIAYHSAELTARTWVRADASAHVLRQEVETQGQRLAYVRDNEKAVP